MRNPVLTPEAKQYCEQLVAGAETLFNEGSIAAASPELAYATGVGVGRAKLLLEDDLAARKQN